MNNLANHLWQSTIFAAVVAVAALALRRNSARLRYWLWLAASAKFLIPFSILVSMGGRVAKPGDAAVLPALTVVRVSTYFAPVPTFPVAAPVAATSHWPAALGIVWLAVSILVLLRWFRRWHRIRNSARRARPLPLGYSLPVLSSPSTMEPGVFGLFRPVLLLPEGIVDSLSQEQFEAVLAHELCHVRYWDNLTAALHMCVETLFWFHPMIWWIGAKLVEERERACDQSVLKRGSQPAEYAQGIVEVCRSYVESPLPCAAGITGASLKKRIREIMTWRGSLRLTLLRKSLLAAASILAVAVPVAIGILRAQTLPPQPAYTYEAVSIHPSKPGAEGSRIGPGPEGGLRTQNTTAMQLLTFAYRVQNYQIAGAPGWVTSDRFDVTFTPEKAESTPGPGTGIKPLEDFIGRNQQRMQAVFRDRFGLVIRAETHELPIYALVPAKGGVKLTPSVDPMRGPSLQGRRGQITCIGATLKMLAGQLSTMLGRPVNDETGLGGQYDFKVEYTPETPVQSPPEGADNSAADSPSIFTALTEQLGLRLEPRKGPVPVYVIEKIEKPGEN